MLMHWINAAVKMLMKWLIELAPPPSATRPIPIFYFEMSLPNVFWAAYLSIIKRKEKKRHILTTWSVQIGRFNELEAETKWPQRFRFDQRQEETIVKSGLKWFEIRSLNRFQQLLTQPQPSVYMSIGCRTLSTRHFHANYKTDGFSNLKSQRSHSQMVAKPIPFSASMRPEIGFSNLKKRSCALNRLESAVIGCRTVWMVP